ncbi:iwsip-like protein [Cryptosporidium canis]|uniref:Iwsip-like protein n=1 Tax=Cryptosporidium canis TaxID=195482 RepID=A0ABQ8P7N4_9CRYT|nr:iwsip-like protein [Cryptosporidium canis]KAJ1613915.1 iwsip-like protein [Cryptosporidium canis]
MTEIGSTAESEQTVDASFTLNGQLSTDIHSKNKHSVPGGEKKRKVATDYIQESLDNNKDNNLNSNEEYGTHHDDFIVDDGSSDFDEDDVIRVEGGIKSSDDECDDKVGADYAKNKLTTNKHLVARKFSETEIRSEVRQFIQQMKDAAKNDEAAYRDGKVAISKLKMVDEVCKRVSMNNLSSYFISEGVLDVLSQWISPFNDGTLPNLSIRTKILKLINNIPLGEEELTSTDLGKVLCRLWKSSSETIENRQIIRTLIQRWVRLISKPIPSSTLSTTNNTTPTTNKVNSSNNSNSNGTISKDNALYVEPRTARIPVNTGYNFKVIPQNDSSSIEEGTHSYNDKSIGGISISRNNRTKNKSMHAMKISLEGRGL